MKLYRDIFGKDVGEYITLKPFLESFNGYKGGKYAPLFSDINADLRNAFSHGDIEFPNDKIFYYTRDGRLEITLEELLSKFKKLPPLCVYLFQNRLKPFKKEIEEYARKMGYL